MKERLDQDMLALLEGTELTEKGKRLKEAVEGYTDRDASRHDKTSMFLLVASALNLRPAEFTEILGLLTEVNEQARKKYGH
ncbi:hypothetical protein [Bacillus thuringiensis]|uniref:hypothetical protein n=1 Tax=Bacillus thuringiensis TaxID=1428 RepID=UPI000BFE1C02|nr:hypothetical protein [Bacillus thuringiensis]PGT90064.1 hypothetical protein COD17_09955 [Bacillus thuringiensis]